jgi:hypothetical protein
MQRLDDKIRELCALAVQTEDPARLHDVLEELRAAIHEHAGRLRKMAINYPVPPERRG